MNIRRTDQLPIHALVVVAILVVSGAYSYIVHAARSDDDFMKLAI